MNQQLTFLKPWYGEDQKHLCLKKMPLTRRGVLIQEAVVHISDCPNLSAEVSNLSPMCRGPDRAAWDSYAMNNTTFE